jgi:hypothetical protein
MVRGIKYWKLIRFVEDNPAYEVNRNENWIELIFYAPSLSEAAEVGDVSTHETLPVMRLSFKIEGDMAYIREAWVERKDKKKALDPGEFEVWLEYIDSQYAED